jgi:site-specific recombinase XerD
MSANVVRLDAANTSENKEFSGGIRFYGSRGYAQTKEEIEHAAILISLFEKHLIGTRALAATTVVIAMGTLRGFATWTGLPPWQWAPQDFAEFIAEKVKTKDIGLGRQSTYITYLRSFQRFILDSRGLSNDIHRKFGVQPQRFINEENSIPIRRKRYERKKSICPLSAQQCQALIEQFDIEITDAKLHGKKSFRPLQRNKVMVIMLLMTGIRVEELVSLRLRDFQPDPRRPEFGNYALMTVVLGKGRKTRVIRQYNPAIRDFLDWYIDEIRPAFLKVTTKDPNLLFLSERGSGVCTEQVRRMLEVVAKKAGIETRITPHGLRHTYGTQMANVIGAEALQKQLGHENLTTTLGTYYHQDPEKVGLDIEIGITNLTSAIDAMTEGFLK